MTETAGQYAEPKNIGFVIAGGIGARMGAATPKQFIRVVEKEVIFYTLEAFQQSREIDAIVVACLSGWEDILISGAERYGISKMLSQPCSGMVKGGETGMQSLRNGMLFMREHYHPDSIVVIHDAVRPLVSQKIISSNIEGVKEYGTAVTAVPASEALLGIDQNASNRAVTVVDRNLVARTQTPQSLRLSHFVWVHEEAVKRGIHNTVATCTLLIELGETVHLVPGETSNFKLTTQDDIELMEAYILLRRGGRNDRRSEFGS